jgi:hypothetical protein
MDLQFYCIILDGKVSQFQRGCLSGNDDSGKDFTVYFWEAPLDNPCIKTKKNV